MTERYNDGADVGDILVAKWGYDQTNASWFRVERRTEKSVWLVELARGSYEETGFMQGRETPGTEVRKRERWTPSGYVDDTVFRRKLSFYRDEPTVRMASYMYAHPWSGNPEWTSSYA